MKGSKLETQRQLLRIHLLNAEVSKFYKIFECRKWKISLRRHLADCKKCRLNKRMKEGQ